MATKAPPDLEALAAMILASRRTLVLTGVRMGAPAGSESPDAREGAPGWAERASLEAFLTEPGRFWDYYFPIAQAVAAREPGPGHRAIARMQEAGLVWALVTQAVDRLHQRAGSPEPVEVYGQALTARCERCGERYGLPEVGALIAAAPDGVPRCSTPGCAYPLRPGGTLWNEPLPQQAVSRAWELAAEADCFVALDCELRTAPIALLPAVALRRGVPLVLVGHSPTRYDRYARVVMRGSSEPVLAALERLVLPRGGGEAPE
jgi:NAD-dependent deacetylase